MIQIVHKAGVGSRLVKLTNDHVNDLIDSNDLPEILVISTNLPRECGIATYSDDLIKALNNSFGKTFNIGICALETNTEKHTYGKEVSFILNTDSTEDFDELAKTINASDKIRIVLIQHEFGLFASNDTKFEWFVSAITKPVIVVFHTVLPHPGESLKLRVQHIANTAASVIVMTKTSAKILTSDYGIAKGKITIIAHGTHLVPHSDKLILKEKYGLTGKSVLSTFGLLSSGKSIETTLDALPAIVKINPDTIFLIIGKTHPSVFAREGETYRRSLEEKILQLGLTRYVRFINTFLPLPELLEYLQLTDIYLFTSKDPNQAVSGTFSYAISCGCAIVSTPIPHALEVLKNDAGILIDFEQPAQLASAVITLLKDDELRNNISANGIHRIASTSWQNAAIAHVELFKKTLNKRISLKYSIPDINLDHIKKLTTDFGIIQFSKINKPDILSGYTVDDNARALIAFCQHYELTADETDLDFIRKYFRFIQFCQQPGGNFLNYVDAQYHFTPQNGIENLEDSNGRVIWALGYLISMGNLLPEAINREAIGIMKRFLPNVQRIHSTRAMAFIIKGLYYANTKIRSEKNISLLKELANRLVQMYRHECHQEWYWFESYLTYANSLLPESMLCAWLATNEPVYKKVAKESFDFLLSKTFRKNSIHVISNKTWLHKNVDIPVPSPGGEQPIDVAYTTMALSKFYNVFKEREYIIKMENSFNWFLGKNHLSQIIYNPCTGGCYDGLEVDYINLNQGAESTISYLMARLTVEKVLWTEGKCNTIKTISKANDLFSEKV